MGPSGLSSCARHEECSPEPDLDSGVSPQGGPQKADGVLVMPIEQVVDACKHRPRAVDIVVGRQVHCRIARRVEARDGSILAAM